MRPYTIAAVWTADIHITKVAKLFNVVSRAGIHDRVYQTQTNCMSSSPTATLNTAAPELLNAFSTVLSFTLLASRSI